MYKLLRVLNNNAILVKDLNEEIETIFMGKGVGFSLKDEDEIDLDIEEIERAFVPLANQWTSAYLKLIDTVDEKILSVCSEIVLRARETLGDLHSSIFVVLTGHINFAIERLNKNVEIENPLLTEIQLLYPNEYAVGLYAQELIEKRLDISFRVEESAYIALHLNAARLHQDVKTSLKKTNIIRVLVSYIQEKLHIKIKDKLVYRQLLDHMRGVIDRNEQGAKIENLFLPEIHKQIPNEQRVARGVAELMEKHLGLVIGDAEIGYIALHLYRLRRMLL